MLRSKRVRQGLLPFLIAVGLVALSAGGALADLMVDVRVDSVSGSLTQVNNKTVNAAGAGTITLGIYAVPGYPSPTGVNAVNTVMGDIVRVPGGTGINGAYTGAAYDAAFSTGSQNGTVQDVNGDGFNDIGSTLTEGYSDDVTAFFSAGAGSTFNVNDNGLSGIKVGTATYQVSSVTAGGTPALLNFWKTDAGDILGLQGLWREGVNDPLHNMDDSSGSMYVGANVSVNAPAGAIPEPSTLVLLGMGTFLVLAWRKRR